MRMELSTELIIQTGHHVTDETIGFLRIVSCSLVNLYIQLC